VPVWALAPYGRAIAEREVPWLRPPAASDIGHRFLEHTLVLNDVLVDLVLAVRRGSSSSLADLPFRWVSENDETLSFRTLDLHGAWQRSVLKPDAVIAIAARRSRLFVEAETGSQSIATANPDRTGAVLAKLARYRTFLTGLDDDVRSTWYRSAFPDGYEPRLLFLVHSDERRRKVELAVRSALGTLPPREFRVIVLTCREAPRALLSFVTDGALPAPGPRAERVVTFDEASLPRLREGYNAFCESYNATRRVIADFNARGGPQLTLPPAPRDAISVVREFVARVVESGRRTDTDRGNGAG
jgi:hypothetical protein